ncbi:hypothetical protein HK105_203172 [Polyrhizophydium stewartii]|uniref:CBS domain-containing protein n=1 Tax=Polyrhizophydium stewartii TaxID=2732419 RepID=A0ABR4NC49_9FUNG
MSSSLAHYLGSKTVKDFIASRPARPLVSCEDIDALPEAMQRLVDNGVLAMPVYSHSTGEYVGLIGMLEIVKCIADLHWEFLESPKPYREAEIYVEFNKRRVSETLTPRQVKISESATYLVAIQTLISGGLRRLPVMDASTGRITHIVTESEVVDVVFEGLSVLDPAILARPLSRLGVLSHLAARQSTDDLFRVSVTGRTDSKLELMETGLVSVNGIAKAIEAFRVIVSTGVSAVPIVDFDQAIQSTISVRDIRRIAANAANVRVLYEEDCAAFSRRAWAERGVDQPGGEGDKASQPLIFVSKDDTVRTAVERLHANKMHRVWVVDDKRRPVGVVTLRDVVGDLL